ncbi:MAG: hypothetical protein AB7E32_14080 [Desulfovibrio sp.]
MSDLLKRIDAALREIDAALNGRLPVPGYGARLVMASHQLTVVRNDERARLSRLAALASESDCCERGAYVHR